MARAAVTLRWTGESLRFRGGAVGGPEILVDGDGKEGPSPMQTLLLAVAGCTAADVVEILTRMHVPPTALELELDGERAPDAPRYYTAIRTLYRVRGVPPEAEGRVRRAVALSQEKYCSVLHTLRPDVEWTSDVALL